MLLFGRRREWSLGGNLQPETAQHFIILISNLPILGRNMIEYLVTAQISPYFYPSACGTTRTTNVSWYDVRSFSLGVNFILVFVGRLGLELQS